MSLVEFKNALRENYNKIHSKDIGRPIGSGKLNPVLDASGDEKYLHPKYLRRIRPVHREIMRRLIRGQKLAEIAKDLDLTPVRVSTIANSPLFLSELKRLEKTISEEFVKDTAKVDERVRGKIQSLSEPSVDLLGDILNKQEVNGDHISPRLKKDVAMEILELAGHGRKHNGYNEGMSDFAHLVTEAFKLAENNRNGNSPETVTVINITPENNDKKEEVMPCNNNAIANPSADFAHKDLGEDYANELESNSEIDTTTRSGGGEPKVASSGINPEDYIQIPIPDIKSTPVIKDKSKLMDELITVLQPLKAT